MTRSRPDPEILFREAVIAARRCGYDVGDDEVLSACNLGVAEALAADVRGEVNVSLQLEVIRNALCECARHAHRMYWESLDLCAESYTRDVIRHLDFSDGSRFCCIPWRMLRHAALERGFEVVGSYARCDEVPEGCVAVSPDTFDRLLGEAKEVET